MTADPPTLTVRPYTGEDFAMVCLWYQQHGGDRIAIALPPNGVIVEDEKGPACALWLAEPAGFATAYFEIPISRPGLPLSEACAAFKLAVSTLIDIAGERFDPPGKFHSFRAVTPPSLARVLMRMGFVQETMGQLIPMIYHRE